MSAAPAAVPYRVKNTFVEPVPEDVEKSLRRSNSWSVSSGHSHSDPNNLTSSDSTQAQFFSTSHAEQSLQGILNDSDSERETAVQQSVPSEREQQQAPAPDDFSTSSPSWRDSVVETVNQAFRHDANKCVPCVRLMLGKHCESQSSCSFCHLPHEERSLVRPTKELRLRCKQSVTKVNSRYQHDQEAKLEAIQNLLANQAHHIRNYTIKLLLGEDEDKHASSSQAMRGDARASSSDEPLPVGRCGAAIVEDAADTVACALPFSTKTMFTGRASGSSATASKPGLISRDANGYQGPVMPGLQNAAERPSDQRIRTVPQQAPKVVPGKIGKGTGKLSL